MRKWYFMIILVLITILVACGEREYEARDVKPDTDVCEVCNMAVPANQHATQIILEDGKHLMFDDLGCLYKWKVDHPNETIGAEFVRDFHTEEWMEVDTATFVYDKDIMTPMAYNIISFSDKTDAEEYIEAEGIGEILEPSDLENHHWERNKEMMMKHKEMMEEHDHGSEDDMENMEEEK